MVLLQATPYQLENSNVINPFSIFHFRKWMICLEGDTLAPCMEMEETSQRDAKQIKAWLKETFTDDTFTVYRKLTMVRWAGEHVNIFRQLIRLTGFEVAEMERLNKLVFVTGFPNTISIELQQALNIKALTMGDLLARVTVLMTTGDQSQDVVAAVHSPCRGTTPSAKSDPITSITCYRQGPHNKGLLEVWNTLLLMQGG